MAGMAASAPLEVTGEVLQSCAPGRFFRDASAPLLSLDFHRTEDLLVCAGTAA